MSENHVLRISNLFSIPENSIVYETCRASGPGGQHVNTTDSAVQLRFHVTSSPDLPEPVRVRLLMLAGNLITRDGWLVIRCDRFRQQIRNRFAARERFVTLLLRASKEPKRRIPTAVPRISKEARLALKARVSWTKRQRRRPEADE